MPTYKDLLESMAESSEDIAVGLRKLAAQEKISAGDLSEAIHACSQHIHTLQLLRDEISRKS